MFMLNLRYNNCSSRPNKREEYQYLSEDVRELRNKIEDAISHLYYEDIYFCVMEIPEEFSVVEIGDLNIIDEDYL